MFNSYTAICPFPNYSSFALFNKCFSQKRTPKKAKNSKIEHLF